jgi:hypothetical protein
LDVHPPHGPIHSWKDFLVHLLTITVGLCIALALEALVEAGHHRHIVHEAYANLRLEIEANHELYQKNVQALADNRAKLQANLQALRALRDEKRAVEGKLKWGWSWDGYTDAAWRSANAIGAVPYMDLRRLEPLTHVYRQQDYVTQDALSIFSEENRASAPLAVARDPAHLRPDELEALLISCAQIDLRLATLQSTMASLDEMYREELAAPR